MTSNGYRAFEAERTGDPIGFYLHGEKFEIPRPLPFLAALELVENTRDQASKPAARRVSPVMAMWRFLNDVLPAPEVERLKDVMRRDRTTAGVVDEIARYVIEEASARPTGRRSASADSPSTSGRPSKRAASSPASSRRPSRSGARSR